ncbi:MAG: hypothetical protein ACOC4H_03715 [bacterium]
MFCPKCKYEYKEGISSCPDCGADMVEELVAEEDEKQKALEKENNLVYADDAAPGAELEFIKAVFNEEGIAFYIEGQGGTFAKPVIPGEARIFAEKEKLERAREIILEVKESEYKENHAYELRNTGEEANAETAELCEISNEFEGDVIRDMLAQEGIHSFVRSNLLPHSRLSLHFFRPKGMGTIIVNKEDIEKAEKVLDDYKKSL